MTLKPLKIAEIILLVAVVIGGGWWGDYRQNTHVEHWVLPTPTESVDTTGWQTYQNNEYGFEIQYPGDWLVDICPNIDNCILFGSKKDKYETEFVYVEKGKTYQQVKNERVSMIDEKLFYFNESKIRLGDLEWIKFEAGEKAGEYTTSFNYYIEHGGDTFNVSQDNQDNKWLLTTFKFTN